MKKWIWHLVIVVIVISGAFGTLLLEPYAKENEVYLALLRRMETAADFDKVTFLSYPSNCGVVSHQRPQLPKNLWLAFQESNSEGANPIRLTSLEGEYNVIPFDVARKAHETEGASLTFVETDKKVVKLSRVGFFADQALLCVEGQGAGELYLLDKGSGQWQIAGHELLWVR